jgi:hypothetical protein
MTSDLPGVSLSDQWVGRITVGTTVAALGLSYRNQLDFATQVADYPLWAALVFPLIIDSFVLVGELRLYSVTARRYQGWFGFRIKLWAWLLTLAGLAASAAAGVAHVGLEAPAGMKLAAAVPPLAAAASLGTGLGIVKLRARQPKTTGQARAAAPTPQQGTARKAGGGRARSRGNVPPQLLERLRQDAADGLSMTKRDVMTRYDITDHRARTAIGALSNGSGH